MSINHRANTTDQCQADPRTHSEKALDLIADRLYDVVLELRVGPIPDTIAEIRDRLAERVEAGVAAHHDPDPDREAVEVLAGAICRGRSAHLHDEKHPENRPAPHASEARELLDRLHRHGFDVVPKETRR